MRKCLLNASNIHVGGAIQVAVSVIGELTLLSNLPKNLVVWASTGVAFNLRNAGYNPSRLPNYEIKDTFGIRLLISSFARQMHKFDVIFSIFGPLYLWKFRGQTITGFAQPWIIYPNVNRDLSLTLKDTLFNRLKYKIQSAFFRRANEIVVEADHVKLMLLEKGIGSTDSIHVVHNTLSSVYLNPEKWIPVTIKGKDQRLKIGFVGRNYPHKNTRIFPEVIKYLRSSYGIDCDIYVTFTEDEWANCDVDFRQIVSNVGPLYVAQCPLFYKQMDAVIFPSLLECFSATPLEAMAMERPLFASDRPFNRDVCGTHAHYFDPLNPLSAAECIARFFSQQQPDATALQLAREHAIKFSSPKVRAERYLSLITQNYHSCPRDDAQ